VVPVTHAIAPAQNAIERRRARTRPARVGVPKRTPEAAPVVGTVVDAQTGYPIAGVRLAARSDRGVAEPMAIAVTNEGGRFQIHFPDHLAPDRIAAISRGDEPIALEISHAREERSYPLASPTPVFFPAVLRATLPRPPIPLTVWQVIGERMETSRLVQLHTLAKELLLPDGEGVFGDLDLEVRHAVVAELERSFLDPTGALSAIAPPTFGGLRAPRAWDDYRQRVLARSDSPDTHTALADLAAKLGSFESLFDIDWVTDTMAMKSGATGVAATKFQDVYASSAEAHGIGKPTDRSRYRDYLVAIWTGGPHAETHGPNLDVLQARFHQSFTTLVVNEQSANAVLIPVLKKILTAPTGSGYGFSIPSADIEPKGDRTDREYLDYLIGLTPLSARELGLRYRINLERPDSALSSPVDENIHTLQRFLGDSFQDRVDPLPIVPEELLGRAPFFLFYEEWLVLQKPFYPENVYQPFSTFSSGISEGGRNEVATGVENEPWLAWLQLLIDADDSLTIVRARLDQGQIGQARDELDHLRDVAWEAYDFSFEDNALGPKVLADQTVLKLDAGDLAPADIEAYADQILDATIASPPDLAAFTAFYRVGKATYETPSQLEHPKLWEWLNGNRMRLWFGLVHLIDSVIPAYQGDAAFAAGDYEEAIFHYRRGSRRFVAHATHTSEAGYRPYSLSLPEAVADPGLAAEWQTSFDWPHPPADVLYDDGGLPYTIELTKKAYEHRVRDSRPFGSQGELAAQLHAMERRFFRIRQAEGMLEWADALYRSDEPSNIQRARELYKDVLWLHGTVPPSFPTWGARPGGYGRHSENPAVASQKARARAALTQIAAGLNIYGATDTFVPLLRYRPLKEAADRLAAAASAAQQDFLGAMSKMEDALRENLITNTMLRKAKLLAQIAGEQAKIAEFAVAVAENQVVQVQKAIEAKRAEIEDHDELWTQFTDVVGGMVDTFGTIEKVADKGGSLTGIEGEEVKQTAKLGAGMSYAEAGSMSGAAAGGLILGGYVLFLYVGLSSLSAANDAQTARKKELAVLRDVALPLARGQVEARKREVTIANLQKQIAVADAELALELLKFQATRFLSTYLWTEIAQVLRRVLRRYLALGARFGWLAERALAHEQDRPLDVIRLDYYPEKLQGVTGADLLQADLAELEASRLEEMRQRLPIRRSYSLAFDFPFAFAKLRKTGRCSFVTTEDSFRVAYPGTFGYRIRAVTAAVKSYAGTPPLRGLLINMGVSSVSRSNGDVHGVLRPVESAPLSEFRLADDMAVFGLPGETLFTFEGSGVETIWALQLTPAGNTSGLDAVADVELTLDLLASWSPELYPVHLAAAPTTIDRFVLVSGLAHDAAGVAALLGDGAQAEITFNLKYAKLPSQESDRILTNIVILLTGVPVAASASLDSDAGSPVPVQIEAGFAASNAPPLTDDESSVPPSPLNVFAGQPVDQVFRVTIDKTANPDVDFSGVVDVVLGIQYTAHVPAPSGIS
jgi:hypothetical protein